MTTSEIKKYLIHRIEEIDDLALLEKLKSIIDNHGEANIKALSEEQKNETPISEQEIDQSLFLGFKVIDGDLSKWTNGK
ncbi:MAG: hypothetical protein M9887_06130 [Chitinophagales bacterium]|nr:hypothetical protein [Chitinophagales bacterium]